MNHIQRDFLEFLLSTTEHWEHNFSVMPEVWIGIGRPQRRLSENERMVAKIGVTVTRVVLETVLERA